MILQFIFSSGFIINLLLISAATIDSWRVPPSSPVTVTTSPSTDPWSPIPSTSATAITTEVDTNKKQVRYLFFLN